MSSLYRHETRLIAPVVIGAHIIPEVKMSPIDWSKSMEYLLDALQLAHARPR